MIKSIKLSNEHVIISTIDWCDKMWGHETLQCSCLDDEQMYPGSSESNWTYYPDYKEVVKETSYRGNIYDLKIVKVHDMIKDMVATQREF